MNSLADDVLKRQSVILSAVFFLLAGFIVPAAGQEENANDASLSARRVELFRKTVREEFQQTSLDENVDKIHARVLTEFSSRDDCKHQPAEPATTGKECRDTAEKAADRLANRKFPPLDEETLGNAAAEIYPIYREGDPVTLTYLPNPVRPTTITGKVAKIASSYVQVGSQVVLFEDLKKTDYGKAEIVKFNAPKSMELRRNYIEKRRKEYESQRNDYRTQAYEIALRLKRKEAIARNQSLGYILYEDKWFQLPDLASTIINQEKTRMMRELAEAMQRRIRESRAFATIAVASQSISDAGTPGFLYSDPFDATAQAAPQAETVSDIDEEEAEESPETPPFDQETATPEADATASGPEETGEETISGTPIWIYAAAAGGVLVVLVLIGLVIVKKRSKKPSNLFTSGSKMHKQLWAKAEAAPDDFKYVAYRFASMESAREALLQLSYVQEEADGTLSSAEDVLYGIYAHDGKFVAYVAGMNLGYAPWREASALFPELYEAEYFRVSSAPEVKLEIPDIEKLMADESIEVEHIQNIDGIGDDFGKYYIYETPDKETALVFLERVSVDSGGIHIIAKTPEGIWGRDSYGVYEDEGEIAALLQRSDIPKPESTPTENPQD